MFGVKKISNFMQHEKNGEEKNLVGYLCWYESWSVYLGSWSYG